MIRKTIKVDRGHTDSYGIVINEVVTTEIKVLGITVYKKVTDVTNKNDGEETKKSKTGFRS